MKVSKDTMLRSFYPIFLFYFIYAVEAANDRPVIALIGQEITVPGILEKYPFLAGKSYVSSGYVKFIEAAGAQVLPVKEHLNSTDWYDIFYKTNGVVFPGGHEDLVSSPYEKSSLAFNYFIRNASRSGDYYPLLGICLGIEEQVFLSANKNILSHVNATNIGLPMKFTSLAETSKFFQGMPKSVKDTYMYTKAAFNSHEWGITVNEFRKWPSLMNGFDILSTSLDQNGAEFIAALESKNYPIFGLQWHPEKTRFEWKRKLNVDHSEKAVLASQFIGNRFLSFARQNKHRFPVSWEHKLISSYKVYFTGDVSIYNEIYVINDEFRK